MKFYTGYDMNTHYATLMALCESNEAFYFVEHEFEGDVFRVFTYRLASYSDFQLPGALECRGHTFMKGEQNGKEHWLMASLPMEKFFNVGENPMTMNLDFSRVSAVDDKRDGSLISTVITSNGFTLKSKTSFNSEQARAARVWLDAHPDFKKKIEALVRQDYTVNMEWTSPSNQIVLAYKETELRVLNVRDNWSGRYRALNELGFAENEIVDGWFPRVDLDGMWIDSARAKTGVEGWVLHWPDGMKAKLKTDWYSNLHLQKDSVNNPRRLFESVIMEQSDDLKALFLEDPGVIERITDMEVMAKGLYNRLHKTVESFYLKNKELSRKDYAIKGQAELNKDGVFALAMNLYLGHDMGLKEHLIKNYKKYGIVDTMSTAGTD